MNPNYASPSNKPWQENDSIWCPNYLISLWSLEGGGKFHSLYNQIIEMRVRHDMFSLVSKTSLNIYLYSLKKVFVHYFRKFPVEKICCLRIWKYPHDQEQYFIYILYNFGIYSFYGFYVMHKRTRRPPLFSV